LGKDKNHEGGGKDQRYKFNEIHFEGLILTPLIQFQIGQKNTEQKIKKSRTDIIISP
jgi:hypothetical protein